MKVTLSVIKADVGSIGGHTRPSERMLDTVRAQLLTGIIALDDLLMLLGSEMGHVSHALSRGLGRPRLALAS